MAAWQPRIGYVVKRYPRFSETFIVNEILAHEAAGFDVEIFALNGPVDTHFQDIISRVRAPVRYLRADRLKANDLWSALTDACGTNRGNWSGLATGEGLGSTEIFQAALLAKAIRQRGIDHLHAHFATSATDVARMAAALTGITYSLTAHAKDIFHQDVDIASVRTKLADASAVVTVSDYNIDFIKRHYGTNPTRLHRIYNGLDLNNFSYCSPENRPPEIISVGRLVEKKGFIDLIEACALLKTRGCKFRCQLVGSGDLEDTLSSKIGELGLSDHVIMSGPRSQAEVKNMIAEAAVLAAPCVVADSGDRDGLPTVLIEAMAIGTPCVSTDVTGIPEIVRDEETGLVVGQHDPGALADALERLLTNAGDRTRLSVAARRLIEQDFDVHRSAARLRDLFAQAAIGTGHIARMAS